MWTDFTRRLVDLETTPASARVHEDLKKMYDDAAEYYARCVVNGCKEEAAVMIQRMRWLDIRLKWEVFAE